MASEIERIKEYEDGNSVYRTTCECMGDDNCTFTINVDEDYPEYRNDISGMVYLEFGMDTSRITRVWDDPKWSRGIRSLWERVKLACSVLATGRVHCSGGFIFRGEAQIDELCETIQSAKNRAKQVIESKSNES